MRKYTLLILLLCYAAFLSAQEKKPLVVATASIFAEMAETISGGLVDIQSIVPIGGDPHIYEPTPGNASLIASADLILQNGLTFEGWLSELIANSGTRARIVTITEGIDVITSDKYHNSADPHAWMAASNGLLYAKNIYQTLVDLDPDNADIYDFNYRLYRQQIEDLDAYIQKEIERIPEQRRILITSHDAFRYYSRQYGIQVEAVLGTSTDADVQTSDVARLTRIIRESGVPAVFIESTVNPKLLRQLATDTGIRIGGSLYADSLGDKDSPAATYLDMLRYNTNTIVAALLVTDQAAAEPATEAHNNWLFAVIIALMAGSFFFMVTKLNASV